MIVINNGTVVTMDDERSVYLGGAMGDRRRPDHRRGAGVVERARCRRCRPR